MTIKDLARLSGYSLGTVSRVLNNQPNVSEKARETIMAIVNEAGFELNTNAKNLKQQKSTSIAVIIKGRNNEMFADIAEYDVKVGDITIIAEIENTLPLALEAEVELFDANGEAVDIDVTFVEGYDRINGSEDGVTAANSTLRLNIGAGKSIDTKKLSKIDGITFTLVAKSDANGSVAINAKQGVGARLSLELDGGITVDVKDFMTSNN